MRGRRNFGPLLLKYGVAVCLSLGGILYTILRNKGIKPSKRTPLLPPSTDYDHSLQTTPPSCLKRSVQTTPCACASSGSVASKKCAGLSGGSADLSGPSESFRFEGKGVELQYQVSALREYISVEREEHDEEVRRLKGIVKTLKERERNLEIKLLEYYGLKEQETAVKELQNRININTMEAKLFALKIESLKADKKKLEAQMADSATVVSELEAARAKIKQLKKKLRREAEHRKEQICALQEKVMKLQNVEKKALETLHYQEKKLLEVESDAHTKVQRIEDLEIEAEELRSCNNSLRTENSELAQRLEYVQIIATSVLDDEEMEALVAEAERLRKQNADMAKEIEELRSHRCSDAEELVYLRWVNACLRYELRNYQPDPNKTVARDLSKTLSPKSEERAKQLILEYARREEEEGVGPHFGSSERSSSSHASFLTPSDDISFCSSTPSTCKAHTSGKRKVFGKMMRLLRGKRNSRSSSSQGSFGRSKHFSSQEEEEDERMQRKRSAHQDSFRMPELVKYAEALKEGRNLPLSRSSRRSASFGSLA